MCHLQNLTCGQERSWQAQVWVYCQIRDKWFSPAQGRYCAKSHHHPLGAPVRVLAAPAPAVEAVWGVHQKMAGCTALLGKWGPHGAPCVYSLGHTDPPWPSRARPQRTSGGSLGSASPQVGFGKCRQAIPPTRGTPCYPLPVYRCVPSSLGPVTAT